MTTQQKIARRKLSLLELAADLGNVSKACKIVGYSRQQFYEIRRNFQTYGADGLIGRRCRQRVVADRGLDRLGQPVGVRAAGSGQAVEQAVRCKRDQAGLG